MLAINAGEPSDCRYNVREAGQPLRKQQGAVRALFKEELGAADTAIRLKGDTAKNGEHGIALLAAKLVPQRVADDTGDKREPKCQIKTHLSAGSQSSSGNQYWRKQQRCANALQESGAQQDKIRMAHQQMQR